MRVFNRLLVFALGIALTALGFIVAVEAVWTGLGYRFLWFPGSQWLHTLRTTPWSTRSVLTGAAIASALGLILVAAEVRPVKKRLVRTLSEQDDTWLLHRRSTEHRVRRNLEASVPRSPIKIRLRGSPRRWRLAVQANAAASTKPELEAAAQEELKTLGAPSGCTVTARTTGAGRVQ
jgi:hypothetical protein